MSARERPQPPRERADLEVRVEGARCPYCHDGVREDELAAARVCERCLSRHHGECWQGRCASCQHPRALAAVAETEAGPERRIELAVPSATKAMRVFNVGYIVCMLLAALVIPLAFALEPSAPADDLGSPARVAFAALNSLATAFSLGLWAVNTSHAFRERASAGARALALLSPLTGGISGLLYFLLYANGIYLFTSRGLPTPTGPSSPARPRPAQPDPKAGKPDPKAGKPDPKAGKPDPKQDA